MITTASIPLTPVATTPAGTAASATAAAEATPFGPLFADAQQQAAAARPGLSFEAWLAGAVAAPADGEALPVEAGNGLPPTGEALPVAAAPILDDGTQEDGGEGKEQPTADDLVALLAEQQPPPAPVVPPALAADSATPPLPPPSSLVVTPQPVATPTPATVASVAPTNVGGSGGMTGRLLLSARAAAPAQSAASGDDAVPTPGPTLPVQANAAAAGNAEPAAESEFAAVVKSLESVGVDASAAEPSTPALRESPARQYQHLAGSTASAAVPVPVGKPGWSEAVVDKVMWFSAQQLSSAEIQLNPPELGPLQVRVSTHQDQTSVYFSSHHAAVRDALDQSLPRLREMMDNQGIQLLDVGVGEHGSARQQAFRGDEGEGRGGLGGDGDASGDDGAAEAGGVGMRAPVAVGLVDAYA